MNQSTLRMSGNRTCVQCEEEVMGMVFGIKPTLCCMACCLKYSGTRSKYYDGRLVSVSKANARYHVTADELKALHYRTERNPVDPNGRPMRLFLAAEVAGLRELKMEEIKREAAIEYILGCVLSQMEIDNKKKKLEKRLKVSLGSLDAVLRAFLLGDYLKKSHGSRTTLNDIQQRMQVLGRVSGILAACPRAHPGAVFDFAVAYPEGGVKEFLELQTKAQRVFRQEGDKILEMLSQEDRKKLEGLSLNDAMSQPKLSEPEMLIKWHLDHRGCDSQDYLQIQTTDFESSLLKFTRGRRVDNDYTSPTSEI